MHKRIEKVAVLGAGTMGARISAHLANAGVPSYLLDIVPPDADGPVRNRIAAAGLEAAVKSKPAAFFKPTMSRLVTVGNFEDDLKKLAEVDWIIEAIVEDLEIKRSLLRKVDAVRKPGTIITTNTSGLPVAKIVEGFPADQIRKRADVECVDLVVVGRRNLPGIRKWFEGSTSEALLKKCSCSVMVAR